MAIQAREISREEARQEARNLLRRHHKIVVPSDFKPSRTDIAIINNMLRILAL